MKKLFALFVLTAFSASAQVHWSGMADYVTISNKVAAGTGFTNVMRLDCPNHVGDTVVMSITYSNQGAGTSPTAFFFKNGGLERGPNTNTIGAADFIIVTSPAANENVFYLTNLTVGQAPYLWFTRVTNGNGNALTNLVISLGYQR